MFVLRDELNDYLNKCLIPSTFNDYCPNGLQVEGSDKIQRIILGVTVCQALIDEAVIKKADAIIVHHGLFWQGEPYPIIGMKKKRLQKLLNNDISLWGYHLPLDCHPTLGNNAQISGTLTLSNIQSHAVSGVNDLLWTGTLLETQTVASIKNTLANVFERTPLYLGNGQAETVTNIAWCSGAAQKYIVEAKSLGAQLYFSGEVSEQTMHLAKELGIHYLACGHHATERYGVKALAKKIEQKFSIECEYIDIDNPV